MAEEGKGRELFKEIKKLEGFTNNFGSYTLNDSNGKPINIPKARLDRWTEYHSTLLKEAPGPVQGEPPLQDPAPPLLANSERLLRQITEE